MTTSTHQLHSLSATGAPLHWTVGIDALRARVASRLQTAWNKVAEMVAESARLRADAFLYMKLAELSDAELRRRGLARDTLHLHVFRGSGDVRV